jgi:dihydroorotate dehydrogenase electron transfer subunit
MPTGKIGPMSSPRNRSQFLATVAENIPLCREHYRLVLELPRFPATEPGHFIQISCDDPEIDPEEAAPLVWEPGQRPEIHGRELISPRAVLRRPFSLAGRRDLTGNVQLDIIHRVVGIGTAWLANLKKSDRVGILGPLGNTFQPPPKGGTALLVGGGVGIPPMIYLAGHLAGAQAVAFAGALSRDLLPLTIVAEADREPTPRPCIGEFQSHNIPSVISTDDGSFGVRGFVTQALESFLDHTPPRLPTIYTCGPEAMMKRVADIAIRRGIPCQVAVERAMACGMGTCQSCCIRVKKKDPQKTPLPGRDWCYRLACTDGPVFQAAELLW